MKPIDLCEAHALQPFVACLQRREIDTDRYLERQGIPPELVAAGEGKFIKRLAWDFFADVTRRERIGTLGFLDGDEFTSEDLGRLGSSLKSAVTLQDGIKTFVHLLSNFAQGNTVWLERGGDRSVLWCRTDGLDSSAHVPDDFTVLVLASVVRLAAGPSWRPSAIAFQTGDPGHRRVSDEFADIEIQYRRSGSAIAFPTRLLAEPMAVGVEQNSTSPPLLEPLCEQPLDLVLEIVLESLLRHRRIPTREVMARMLDVSGRTLSRALKDEGITYQRLVERVRFDRARTLLADESTSIKEIAFELGYSEPNNFGRSFRRLSGLTPAEFRRRREAPM